MNPGPKLRRGRRPGPGIARCPGPVSLPTDRLATLMPSGVARMTARCTGKSSTRAQVGQQVVLGDHRARPVGGPSQIGRANARTGAEWTTRPSSVLPERWGKAPSLAGRVVRQRIPLPRAGSPALRWGPLSDVLRILPCGRSGCLSGVSVTHTHQSQRVVGRLPSDERSSDDTWSMTRHSTDSG